MTRKYVLAALLLLLTGLIVLPASSKDGEYNRQHINLVIVVDGLRPDYITPEYMPHLHALGERGIVAERHTSAFPSVTRVNSASISTGSYPARHGLMHNTMFVREFSEERFRTGSARALRRLAKFTDGRLLDSPSLNELLDERGMRLLVTGSGGSGNSLLQYGTIAELGAEIWTAGGFFVPAGARAEATAAVGELASDNPGRTVWAFDAWLHQALSDDPPAVVILWINEPDSAGHRHGVGAPETLQAVAHVDAQLGRILAAHEEYGLADRVNLFVTSDHGFSTNTGQFSVTRMLRKHGFGADDVTVVSNMVFLERDDPALLAGVVEVLQRDIQTGNIYTYPAGPGSSEGIIPGTLSTAAIQWDHDRAADVLVSPAWSDDVNAFGFAGASTRGGKNEATHGSDSPYDLQIRLIAAGPDLKRGIRSQVPTGNVDLAPTVLHLLGVASPPEMSGRVLHELLLESSSPNEVAVTPRTHRATVTLAGGVRYEAELDTVEVGSTVYIRGSRTVRSGLPPP